MPEGFVLSAFAESCRWSVFGMGCVVLARDSPIGSIATPYMRCLPAIAGLGSRFCSRRCSHGGSNTNAATTTTTAFIAASAALSLVYSRRDLAATHL